MGAFRPIRVSGWAIKIIATRKGPPWGSFLVAMVEAGGVEPPSQNQSSSKRLRAYPTGKDLVIGPPVGTLLDDQPQKCLVARP